MPFHQRALASAICLSGLVSFSPAHASPAPTGVWIDHTGRGAVEISECGGKLCGRLVWLKDAKNAAACGTQILGNIKPTAADTWDGGWIYDPEKEAKYNVELKPVGADRLRVVGYLGSKLFSQTLIWKRPATDLERCGEPKPTAAASPIANEQKAEAAPAAASVPVEKAEVSPANTMTAAPSPEANGADKSTKTKQTSPFAAATTPGRDAAAPKKRASVKAKDSRRECRLEIPYVGITILCPNEDQLRLWQR
jgi:uncharacterized protein (DUF2147 family)